MLTVRNTAKSSNSAPEAHVANAPCSVSTGVLLPKTTVSADAARRSGRRFYVAEIAWAVFPHDENSNPLAVDYFDRLTLSL